MQKLFVLLLLYCFFISKDLSANENINSINMERFLFIEKISDVSLGDINKKKKEGRLVKWSDRILISHDLNLKNDEGLLKFFDVFFDLTGLAWGIADEERDKESEVNIAIISRENDEFIEFVSGWGSRQSGNISEFVGFFSNIVRKKAGVCSYFFSVDLDFKIKSAVVFLSNREIFPGYTKRCIGRSILNILGVTQRRYGDLFKNGNIDDLSLNEFLHIKKLYSQKIHPGMSISEFSSAIGDIDRN